MNREAKILTAILVVVVGGMIALFAVSNKANTPSAADVTKNLVRSDSHKQGSGPVSLVEFGDYQCPSCGAAYPIVKQLQADLGAKFTLVFRNFPIPQLHPNATAAAEAAEAAGAQGKYFEMHDKLYETQKDWANLPSAGALDAFVGYAKDLGLDADRLRQEVSESKYKAVIDEGVSDGTNAGVTGTPTFYVNGKQIQANNYATLRDAINAAAK